MKNINYDWYKAFYYVVKNRSITEAAKALFVSQPAVSQSIKSLEDALNCQLLVRNSRGVSLTFEGEVLYEHVAVAFHQLEQGERKLQQIASFQSGEIHIGASDMTLQFYLLPYLQQFHQRYPKIKVHITNGPTPETLESLKQQQIDFGVVSEPFDLQPNMKATRVKTIEDIFIIGKELQGQQALITTYQDLCRYPIIMLEEKTSTRTYVTQELLKRSVSISPAFELATSSLIVQFVKENLGIGCVVKDFAQEAIAQEAVFELHLQNPIAKRNFCIVQAEDNYSQAAQHLIDMMLS